MGRWNQLLRWPADGVMVVHQACRCAFHAGFSRTTAVPEMRDRKRGSIFLCLYWGLQTVKVRGKLGAFLRKVLEVRQVVRKMIQQLKRGC